MTATIVILSIVIIAQLFYIYYRDRIDFDKKNIECRMVGNYSGKCTYGDYHSESEWKDIIHREQLSSQFKKMIELEREIESLKKELSSRPIIIDDVRVLRDEIDRLRKELDFVQDIGNRKEGETLGAHYSKIDLSLEPSEESRKKFMERIKPNPPEDRVINQAKKPVPPKPRNN